MTESFLNRWEYSRRICARVLERAYQESMAFPQFEHETKEQYGDRIFQFIAERIMIAHDAVMDGKLDYLQAAPSNVSIKALDNLSEENKS